MGEGLLGHMRYGSRWHVTVTHDSAATFGCLVSWSRQWTWSYSGQRLLLPPGALWDQQPQHNSGRSYGMRWSKTSQSHSSEVTCYRRVCSSELSERTQIVDVRGELNKTAHEAGPYEAICGVRARVFKKWQKRQSHVEQ